PARTARPGCGTWRPGRPERCSAGRSARCTGRRSPPTACWPPPAEGAARSSCGAWIDRPGYNGDGTHLQEAIVMRYLVTARVKPGREAALLQAIEDGSLGAGSVAGGEYLRNMTEARLRDDGAARWVEVCFCAKPLEEERPYWEEYFDLVKVQDAHTRA